MRIRPDKEAWKYATGTTKKIPKEWESLYGVDFIKYILKKVKE